MQKTDVSKRAMRYAFSLPMVAMGAATTYQPSEPTHIPDAPLVSDGPTESSMAFDERLIDAKLEAVEARTETKFAQLLGELKVVSANVANLVNQIGDIRSDINRVETEIGSVRTATAGVKWNILASGLALGGLIIALAAFGSQILDLAQGLFSAGAASK